jgi:hypothetical protein
MPRILICTVAVILLFGISNGTHAGSRPDDWRNDKECGKRWPSPTKADITGCQKAYCTQLSETSRICSCLPSIENAEGNIFIEKSGTVVQRWKAQLDPRADEFSFRVDAAELTAVGKEEFVVAAMETQSNGMGVQYWTVWAVTDTAISKPIAIHDYGTLGFLTRQKGEKVCNLLVTRWMDGSEPKRGDGLYLVGRWFNFEDGNFTPHFERPIIYRRYLKSFEQQRNKAFSAGKPKPLLWFNDGNTKPVLGPYPEFE